MMNDQATDDKTTDDKAAADAAAKDDKSGNGEGDPKGGDDKGGNLDDDRLSGGKLDVAELLDEYGLDSPDELKEFLAGLSEMKGKIGDADLDTLLENTKTLKEYQANWKQIEEEKLREKETPEETITRLEKEKKDLQKKNVSNAEKQKAVKAAERALDGFTDTVDSVINGAKEIPKEYRPFVKEFMGVDNPINEVDITDKAKVRRLTKEGLKKFAKLEQAVIKRYLDGKIKIPKVSTTETAPGDTGSEDGKPNPKNLKEAKRIMMESAHAFMK